MRWWPWSHSGETKPEKPAGLSLADFTRGLQHALNSMVEYGERASERFFQRHFKEDRTPRIERVYLREDKRLWTDLASILTVSLKRLEPKRMRVRMRVAVERTDYKDEGGISRTSFTCKVVAGGQDVDKDGSLIDMTMDFEVGDPPEGIGRLAEEMARQLAIGESPATPAAVTPQP